MVDDIADSEDTNNVNINEWKCSIVIKDSTFTLGNSFGQYFRASNLLNQKLFRKVMRTFHRILRRLTRGLLMKIL